LVTLAVTLHVHRLYHVYGLPFILVLPHRILVVATRLVRVHAQPVRTTYRYHVYRGFTHRLHYVVTRPVTRFTFTVTHCARVRFTPPLRTGYGSPRGYVTRSVRFYGCRTFGYTLPFIQRTFTVTRLLYALVTIHVRVYAVTHVYTGFTQHTRCRTPLAFTARSAIVHDFTRTVYWFTHYTVYLRYGSYGIHGLLPGYARARVHFTYTGLRLPLRGHVCLQFPYSSFCWLRYGWFYTTLRGYVRHVTFCPVTVQLRTHTVLTTLVTRFTPFTFTLVYRTHTFVAVTVVRVTFRGCWLHGSTRCTVALRLQLVCVYIRTDRLTVHNTWLVGLRVWLHVTRCGYTPFILRGYVTAFTFIHTLSTHTARCAVRYPVVAHVLFTFTVYAFTVALLPVGSHVLPLPQFGWLPTRCWLRLFTFHAVAGCYGSVNADVRYGYVVHTFYIALFPRLRCGCCTHVYFCGLRLFLWLPVYGLVIRSYGYVGHGCTVRGYGCVFLRCTRCRITVVHTRGCYTTVAFTHAFTFYLLRGLPVRWLPPTFTRVAAVRLHGHFARSYCHHTRYGVHIYCGYVHTTVGLRFAVTVTHGCGYTGSLLRSRLVAYAVGYAHALFCCHTTRLPRLRLRGWVYTPTTHTFCYHDAVTERLHTFTFWFWFGYLWLRLCRWLDRTTTFTFTDTRTLHVTLQLHTVTVGLLQDTFTHTTHGSTFCLGYVCCTLHTTVYALRGLQHTLPHTRFLRLHVCHRLRVTHVWFPYTFTVPVWFTLPHTVTVTHTHAHRLLPVTHGYVYTYHTLPHGYCVALVTHVLTGWVTVGYALRYYTRLRLRLHFVGLRLPYLRWFVLHLFTVLTVTGYTFTHALHTLPCISLRFTVGWLRLPTHPHIRAHGCGYAGWLLHALVTFPFPRLPHVTGCSLVGCYGWVTVFVTPVVRFVTFRCFRLWLFVVVFSHVNTLRYCPLVTGWLFGLPRVVTVTHVALPRLRLVTVYPDYHVTVEHR